MRLNYSHHISPYSVVKPGGTQSGEQQWKGALRILATHNTGVGMASIEGGTLCEFSNSPQYTSRVQIMATCIHTSHGTHLTASALWGLLDAGIALEGRVPAELCCSVHYPAKSPHLPPVNHHPTEIATLVSCSFLSPYSVP